jgi:MFS family permease
MLLSTLGVAAGVIAAALLARDWSPDRLEHPYRIVWWVGLVFAAAGSLPLCLVVWPRIRHRLPGPSASYFDEIALLGTVDKVKTALADTDAADRTLTQLVAIARIVRRKYGLIRWAMGLLGIAIALVLIVVIARR